jgi:hypothetical protein
MKRKKSDTALIQMNMNLPKELVAYVKQRAKLEHMSHSAMCRSIIRDSRDRFAKRKIKHDIAKDC